MLTLAPLTRSDLPLLRRWLQEPLVARWWNHETTPEAVERDFGPSLNGADVTELLLVSEDGIPVGLAQRYPIAAYPDYLAELAPVVAVPEGALSIDYLLGEPSARGRGLGAAMIAAVVEQGWDVYPDTHDVLVPVALGNVASWRALERAVVRVAEGELEPDNPIDPRDRVVYLARR